MSADCRNAEKLHEAAAISRKICERILDKYGLTAADVYLEDSRKFLSIIENEICTPEDAGYVKNEDIVNDLCDEADEGTITWCDENG